MIQILIVFIIILGILIFLKVMNKIIKIIFFVLILSIGFYLFSNNMKYNLNLKNFFNIEIYQIERDKDGNLLLLVYNKWFFEAKNLSVYVDGNRVNIINNIDSVSGRKKAIIQTDWNKDFNSVQILSSIGDTIYNKK